MEIASPSRGRCVMRVDYRRIDNCPMPMPWPSLLLPTIWCAKAAMSEVLF